MITILAFLIAIGVLVTIHEYGHYRVAVACGVKVLRFSIGFGKPLLQWKRPQKGLPNHQVEFVLASLPLGGYVKMLDEREAPVEEAEKHLSFNTQPLWQRTLIVLAGPLANLLLAVVLYSAAAWMGNQEALPIVSTPAQNSIAYQAGIRGGEHITHTSITPAATNDNIGNTNHQRNTTRSFDDLRWQVTQAALNKQTITLHSTENRNYKLDLSHLDTHEIQPELFEKIGIFTADAPAIVQSVMPNKPADAAGLQTGDTITAIDNTPITHNHDLLKHLLSTGKAACASNHSQTAKQNWLIQRDKQTIQLQLQPAIEKIRGQCLHRVGIGLTPAKTTLIRYGFIDGIGRGITKTWEFSVLTLRMVGKMLIGQASIKNLSGPLTIADIAGKSASMGIYHYLGFLAVVSVSLGVFNLLPIPVLDGGHLMYYLWEFITGKPPSDVWQERIQRVGFVAILFLMSIAVFNDIGRFLPT